MIVRIQTRLSLLSLCSIPLIHSQTKIGVQRMTVDVIVLELSDINRTR
jgi:hypothetical protein